MGKLRSVRLNRALSRIAEAGGMRGSERLVFRILAFLLLWVIVIGVDRLVQPVPGAVWPIFVPLYLVGLFAWSFTLPAPAKAGWWRQALESGQAMMVKLSRRERG